MRKFGEVIAYIIVFVLLVYFFGWLIAVAWNSVVPYLTGLPRLNVYHGMGILALHGIFFGSSNKKKKK